MEIPPFSISHSTPGPWPRMATTLSSPRSSVNSSASVKLIVRAFGTSEIVPNVDGVAYGVTLVSRNPYGRASSQAISHPPWIFVQPCAVLAILQVEVMHHYDASSLAAQGRSAYHFKHATIDTRSEEHTSELQS